MKEIILFVTYSDDVRLEVGGKQSLMGIYHGELVLQQFPVILPKLCASVVINVPPRTKVDSLSVRCELNGNILGESSIVPQEIPKFQKALEEVEDVKWLATNFTFMFTPLQLDGPGKISVIATVNGESIKGNALLIRQMRPEENIFGQITPAAPAAAN